MKRTLLLLISTIIVTGLFAQSLTLADHDGNSVSNDDTVVLTEEQGATDIMAYLNVTNTSGADMDVLCKKTEIGLITGSTNTFCWTQCYPPQTYVSPTALTLTAGQTDSLSFVGEYYPNGNDGTSTIAYTFYDETNPNDSIRVIVEYAYNVVGLADMIARGDFTFSAAYPNPASSQTSLDFNLPEFNQAQVRVMNLLGSELLNIQLTQPKGRITMDVSDFTEGVYFYTLIVDGQAILTHKLIVQ